MGRSSTSYVPGQSGNPGGRPKAKYSLTALLQAHLFEEDEDGNPVRALDVISALTKEAINGKTAAIQILLDRIDGILQPTPERPDIDLEAIAMAMKAKYDDIRPGGPPSLDEERS